MKTFDWPEFYEVAKMLFVLALTSPFQEALFQCVVSRAYYAAYHRYCAYLRAIGEYPTRQETAANPKESHKFLISKFATDVSHPERYQIGQMLLSLKDFRHQADYVQFVKKHVFRCKDEVEGLLDDAGKIIELLDALPTTASN